MEEQTSEELFKALSLRIKNLEQVFLTPQQATRKERRQYSTRMIVPSNLRPLIASGETPFYLVESREGIPIISDLYQLVKTTLDSTRLLRIKPSMKVNSPQSRHLKIFDALRIDIRKLQSDSKIGCLRDLFLLHSRGHQYERAMEHVNIEKNVYVQDFVNLISQDEIPTPKQWYEFSETYPKEAFCHLRERMYVHRGEVRAFVSDKDEIRTLLGSALHSMLHPRNGSNRHLPPFCDVSPVKTKHLIDQTYKFDIASELTKCLGDISSFTASYKNMWMNLLALIAYIEKKGKNEIVILDINGSLLETNLLEILRCYFYLASACKTLDNEEEFYSLGAMLGIAGVDTLAKVSFALTLRVMSKRHKMKGSVIPKAGGDDFTLDIFTPRNQPSARATLICFLETEITRVIGKLKVLSCINIPIGPADFISIETYCKKRIRIKIDQRSRLSVVKMVSQWPIPLMRALLTKDAWVDEANIFWENTSSAPWVPDHDTIRSSLYALFSLIKSGPIRQHKSEMIYDIPNHIDSFTEGATKLLENVSPVTDSEGNIYKVILAEKLSSLSPDLLEWVPYKLAGKNHVLVSLRGEVPRSNLERFYHLPDKFATIPDEVLEAIESLRDLITLSETIL